MRRIFDYVTPPFIVALVILGVMMMVLFNIYSEGGVYGSMETAASGVVSQSTNASGVRTQARCSVPEQGVQQDCYKAEEKRGQ